MAVFASLALFPSYSLDTSILVAVLIGVVLLALLTETLGWVFVGLVVPGYLASVFVIHPEAGVTIVVEALLTYGLARLLSGALSRTGAWSEFFGRERFFLVVLASVLVRLVSEVWLLPHVGQWLDAELGTSFTLDRTLYSIGLVLVPLTANAFWKLELRRGLLQVGVPVVLTYVILRFVLLPATNLSFSTLELTYEDVAQNFLASPKTYIILLTTAFLAARFNLLYGWDFNGILVPALIALTWFTPAKLVATFAEVLLLVLVVRALLKMPGLRTLNLEGPRKTVLVFFVGFTLKWIIGWLAAGRIPGLKVTDLFGFGYLVPTLLAVKILQKQVIGRVMFATAHTSLAGFLVGSLIGFGLGLFEPRPASALSVGAAGEPTPPLILERPLGVMAYARASAREFDTRSQPLPRRRGTLRRYAQLWVAIDAWLESAADADETKVRRLAAGLGLELHRLPLAEDAALQQYVLVERADLDSKVGWDTALLIPGAKGPILQVPRPVSEAPVAEAAAGVCERIACRAILVSGVDTLRAESSRGDAVRESRTPMGSANEALRERERLVLRADPSVAPGKPTFYLAGERSPQWKSALFDRTQLSRATPLEAMTNWGAPSVFALHVHPEDLYEEVTRGAGAFGAGLAQSELATVLAGRTPPRPLARPAEVATASELVVLERQVTRVLLANDAGGADLPPPALRLAWAQQMARMLGLGLAPVTGTGHGDPTWLLLDETPGRGAGAGLLLRSGGEPIALEVPASVQEPGTLPFALELWRQSNARALLFSDPGTVQPRAHAAAPRRVRTAFHAMHQALQSGLSEEGLVLQLRGYGLRPGLREDAVLAIDGVTSAQGRPQRLTRLLGEGGALAWINRSLRVHDGSPELVRLLNASPQSSFTRTFGGARLATLWLSDHLRGSYLPAARAEDVLAITRAAELPLAPGSPLKSMGAAALGTPSGPASSDLKAAFSSLVTLAERYVAQQDLESLDALIARQQTGRVQTSASARWSTEHGLPYLTLEARRGAEVLRAVTFLNQHEPAEPRLELTAGEADFTTAAERALSRRATVVIFGVQGEQQ